MLVDWVVIAQPMMGLVTVWWQETMLAGIRESISDTQFGGKYKRGGIGVNLCSCWLVLNHQIVFLHWLSWGETALAVEVLLKRVRVRCFLSLSRQLWTTWGYQVAGFIERERNRGYLVFNFLLSSHLLSSCLPNKKSFRNCCAHFFIQNNLVFFQK